MPQNDKGPDEELRGNVRQLLASSSPPRVPGPSPTVPRHSASLYSAPAWHTEQVLLEQ